MIGCLLRYRVTGWHQVATGKQGTSANETHMKRGECKEKGKERADKQGQTNVAKEEETEKETMKERRSGGREIDR